MRQGEERRNGCCLQESLGRSLEDLVKRKFTAIPSTKKKRPDYANVASYVQPSRSFVSTLVRLKKGA